MTTLVPQTFAQGIVNNAESAAKSGSTYVVLVVGSLAAAFAALSPDQQQSLLASFPFLTGMTPIIAAIATYLVTRLKPSSAVSTQTQALIDEIARMKMNQMLEAANQPTIAGPGTITVPPASVPPVMVAVPAEPPPTPKPDLMQTSFDTPPTVVDIPLPIGASASQPIHIMLHQVP